MKFFGILIAIFLYNVQSIEAQNSLVRLDSLDSGFAYEIRYATAENFMNEQLYDCGVCLLRPEVAAALIKANQYFCEQGFKIKIFDCYRPLDAQKQMWAKVPKATYVANPYDGGSIHNKGAAIDLTLVTLEGCYVEMGTDYDYFGREAHIDNMTLPKQALKNRKRLIDGMRAFGFKTIRTEWWHYSFRRNTSYPTLNDPLPCE